MDLEKYSPLLCSQILKEKLSSLSIFKKINKNAEIDEKNLEKSPITFLNLSFLQRFGDPIIKMKEMFFTDIFKLFDRYVSEFCSGEKIIIPKEKYDDFLVDVIQSYFMNCNGFSFEYDLNFIVSLIFILFENNILNCYYKLFITNVKPKYVNIDDLCTKDDEPIIKPNTFSLFERTKFNKVSLNLKKHMKLNNQIANNLENKEKEIIKEKEDIIVQKLFETMQKNKTIKEKVLIPPEQTPLVYTSNHCHFINSLLGANVNYFYNSYINEEENYKTTSVNSYPIYENTKKSQQEQKSKNYNRTNQYTLKHYEKKKKSEFHTAKVYVIAKSNSTSASSLHVEAIH